MRLTALCLLCGLLVVGSVLAGEPGALSHEQIKKYSDKANADEARLRINAITNNGIKELSLNREVVRNHDNRFNVEVKGSDIIDQRSSGRCWMFAGVNTVAPKVMSKMELAEFEISEAYLAFWDKMEKANRFLEKMIELRDKPLDDRVLLMYLDGPMGDGGWWHYFTGLIEKYGVVPASAMGETKQSSSTRMINKLSSTLLRKATGEIRRMHQAGQDIDAMRAYKDEILSELYTMLVYAYGEPPTEFVFRYEKENEEDSTKVLVEETYTPQTFFDEFFGVGMPEYVAIVDNPAMDYGKHYLLEGGRNIEEVQDLTAVNLPIEKLKHYTMKSLLDSQLVWFACDVGPDNYKDSGIFAVDVYDYNTTLGINFDMSKQDRINYNDMSPNHAMVIKGVDTLDNGQPRKWQVENSWGAKTGDKGYWTMYDGWFDENVLLVIIDKRLLEPEDAALFDQKPIVIADWQPFFAALRNLDSPLSFD